MNPDMMGWVANALFLFGSYRIALKDRRGFLWCMVGNVAYLTLGILTGLASVIILNLGMFSLNVFSYYKWGTK